MSRKGVLRIATEGRASFWCPACEEQHGIRIEGPGAWGFNGNYDAPTFTPSVLVTGTRITELGERQHAEWAAAGYPQPAPTLDSKPMVCHSFVTDGNIQYLGDCTHAMAGKTAKLTIRPADLDTEKR